MNKIIIILLLLFPSSKLVLAQTMNGNQHIPDKISYFNLSDVELLDSPFKKAQDLDLKYILSLDPDRLLAPFRREAGLPSKAESYTNWENTGLDGHIGGHYLSALSQMVASTQNQEVLKRLNYMVDELELCQKENGNGYIGGVPGGKVMWNEIASGKIKAGKFDLNGKWVPLYNIHKTYAGLRDAWLYSHNKKAKQMLVQMTDWAIRLVQNLTDKQIQDMLRSEYGGLNETFADVAAITGDEKYLKLARQFSQLSLLNPLLKEEDKLDGMHANTQIPKVIGFERVADLSGDTDWSKAAAFFWDQVVEYRSVCIGGNSNNEHFHPSKDFTQMITGIYGPETCNTYNMLRLSKSLYKTSMDKKYIEYYERALYNHILSTQNPETGGLVYFTPMRPGHYRVYSQPQTSMWCCVGSGIENHSKYGEMIYAHTKNELYVNLFIPSKLNWKEQNVEIVQENRFPDEDVTRLTLNSSRKKKFTLLLRYPDWVKNGSLKVNINGQPQSVQKSENGYVALKRIWKKGDIVEMQLPMTIHAEQLPDSSDYYAFFYGPIVLAAKTGTEDLKGLWADDGRKSHIAGGRKIPMADMPVLVCDANKITEFIQPVKDKNLTFSLSNLFPVEKWGTLELEPFFRLHDARYIIYWPQVTAEKYATKQKEQVLKEKQILHIDSLTIDKVDCGQQQPESDHFIQMENSTTGYSDDRHWRDAEGWFSYDFNNEKHTAAYIQLTCFVDDNRKFAIFVNGQRVDSPAIIKNLSEKITESVYSIPAELKKNDKLIIRFEADKNSRTARISEVRLLEKLP